ncbi:hypothetical protein HYC85_013975 [Camellia sinensis]|uniref:Uncharacterized protein n=1 Tax=Camellia sinensis TaxID=4442 RepID=A0A7J7H8D9_CAMSI|nr:hypothetical protein HYC85_013975 [Camellia sinensis]
MVFGADQSTRGKVSEVSQQASSVGLTGCRTWAFNDGQWRALQISPSVYDENVFKDAFGGKAQYVKWGKVAGLNLTSDDDFFTHPTLKTYYKAHVKACSLITTFRINLSLHIKIS